jgi:hypothetical protein
MLFAIKAIECTQGRHAEYSQNAQRKEQAETSQDCSEGYVSQVEMP